MESIQNNDNSNQNKDIINEKNSFPKWKRMENGTYILHTPGANEIEQEEFKEEEQIDKKVKKSEQKIYTCGEKITVNQMVNCDWGQGKIISIDKENQTAKVKIEGQEISLPISTLISDMNIYVLAIDKSGTNWIMLKVSYNDNVKKVRMKIANLYNVHYTQVVIIHNSRYVRSSDQSVFEIGLYEKDTILAVIKDKKEFNFTRFKNHKLNNFTSGYNSIYIEPNQSIKLTGIGFYKNSIKDIYYDLYIVDDKNKSLFERRHILVNKEPNFNQGIIQKYKIEKDVFLMAGKQYEIRQIINDSSINSQWSGENSIGDVDLNSGLAIKFIDCKNKEEKYGNNMSSPTKGLIPQIYYSFKI